MKLIRVPTQRVAKLLNKKRRFEYQFYGVNASFTYNLRGELRCAISPFV
jgi:hypothetical protein